MENETLRQVLSLIKSPPIRFVLFHFLLEKGRGIGGKFRPSFSQGLAALNFAVAEATLGKKSFS